MDQPLGEGCRRLPRLRVPVFVSRLFGIGLIFAKRNLRYHGTFRRRRLMAVRGEGPRSLSRRHSKHASGVGIL